MLKYWKNLSVAKKLYSVVGVMAFLIAIELFTLFFAMDTLSSVRAFVAGEGVWSKAQKNAFHSLYSYILSKDEKYYRDFKEHMQIPLGDRIARIELSKPNPDLEKTYAAFLQGGVHPQDVPGAIHILQRFGKTYYVRSAVEAWTKADGLLDELILKADKLNTVLSARKLDTVELQKVLAEIDAMNSELTRLEVEFSSVLGEGSRWMEHFLMIVLILAVLTVESTGLILTISLSRNLNKSLRELNDATSEVGKGNLKVEVPVHSQDELGQLAAAINKMARDLEISMSQRLVAENANQVKTLFLANMSHEIRTPLGIILGMTDILKDPQISWEEKAKYLEIIEKTGKNLTRIINDILDITKVEAGHLEVEASQFALGPFFAELEGMMSLKAAENRNQFRVVKGPHPPHDFVADRNRLQQILINLASNALKFTHSGTVTITYTRQGSELHFEVIDTGIGIPLEAQKELFQAFSQVDSSSTRRYEGTGLGLVLSKKLARSMGGDVTLKESSPGIGSVFLLRLPLITAPLAEAPKASSTQNSRHDLQGRSVLIVDDSVDNQLLIRHYLQKRGIICEFADNGQDAVIKAMNNNFDVILMDMQMPVMDGYTATKELRDQQYLKPIIALTAHAMKEDRDRCLSVGCNDYLTKPIEASKLYATLESFIHN